MPRFDDLLADAVALHFMYMNYVTIHQALRVTPAMEAGLATLPHGQ
jgi:hypothetical protein